MGGRAGEGAALKAGEHASSMTGIVPVNCLRSIFHTGVTAAGISFGPNSSSSSAALSEVRPVRAPPALIFPKVSLSTNFCWSAMVRGRRERLTMDLANKLAERARARAPSSQRAGRRQNEKSIQNRCAEI